MRRLQVLVSQAEPMRGKQSWAERRKGILVPSGFFRLRRQDTETGELTRISPRIVASSLVSTLVTSSFLVRGRHALPHYRQQGEVESSIVACRHLLHKPRQRKSQGQQQQKPLGGKRKWRKEGKQIMKRKKERRRGRDRGD